MNNYWKIIFDDIDRFHKVIDDWVKSPIIAMKGPTEIKPEIKSIEEIKKEVIVKKEVKEIKKKIKICGLKKFF